MFSLNVALTPALMAAGGGGHVGVLDIPRIRVAVDQGRGFLRVGHPLRQRPIILAATSSWWFGSLEP